VSGAESWVQSMDGDKELCINHEQKQDPTAVIVEEVAVEWRCFEPMGRSNTRRRRGLQC
jgi:hypothetical protein